MGTASFKTGQAVTFNGEHLTMRRKMPSGIWQLENVSTGEFQNRSVDELHRAYVEGQLKFEAHAAAAILPDVAVTKAALGRLFDSLPGNLKAEAQWRYPFICAVKSAGPVIFTKAHLQPLIDSTWNRIKNRPNLLHRRPPHWTTVYRWYKKYAPGKDIMDLVPAYEARGRNGSTFPPETLLSVEEAVDAVYMTRERNTRKETFLRAYDAVTQKNKLRLLTEKLKLPTEWLVKVVIRQIPYADRLIARYGREYAAARLRNRVGQYVAERLLQYVQMDHTVLDLIVVDEETGLPLGRPYITVSIDLFSRCVHGVYIGFTPPSALSIARCLKHGFLPKVGLQEEFPSIRNAWECHGLMEFLVVDHGLDFHASHLEQLAESFGFIIKYCERKRPWHKPHIERFIGTLSHNLIQTLPGTTFSNFFEKGDYDSVDAAVISLSGLREIIHKWIADFYHQNPHRTLHDRPANVWREAAVSFDVELPTDPNLLEVMMCAQDERRLTHAGIELHGLFYNSADLGDILARYGDKLDVTVRYDEGDLGHIFVTHPDGQVHYKVPAVNQAYAAGINLWQHRIFRRYARRFMKKRTDLEALAEAKRAIAEIVDREFKVRRRKRLGGAVARHRTEGSKALPGATHTPARSLDKPQQAPIAAPADVAVSASPMVRNADALQREMWLRRKNAKSNSSTQ